MAVLRKVTRDGTQRRAGQREGGHDRGVEGLAADDWPFARAVPWSHGRPARQGGHRSGPADRRDGCERALLVFRIPVERQRRSTCRSPGSRPSCSASSTSSRRSPTTPTSSAVVEDIARDIPALLNVGIGAAEQSGGQGHRRRRAWRNIMRTHQFIAGTTPDEAVASLDAVDQRAGVHVRPGREDHHRRRGRPLRPRGSSTCCHGGVDAPAGQCPTLGATPGRCHG